MTNRDPDGVLRDAITQYNNLTAQIHSIQPHATWGPLSNQAAVEQKKRLRWAMDQYMQRNNIEFSSHFMVTADGQIIQLRPVSKKMEPKATESVWKRIARHVKRSEPVKKTVGEAFVHSDAYANFQKEQEPVVHVDPYPRGRVIYPVGPDCKPDTSEWVEAGWGSEASVVHLFGPDTHWEGVDAFYDPKVPLYWVPVDGWHGLGTAGLSTNIQRFGLLHLSEIVGYNIVRGHPSLAFTIRRRDATQLIALHDLQGNIDWGGNTIDAVREAPMEPICFIAESYFEGMTRGTFSLNTAFDYIMRVKNAIAIVVPDGIPGMDPNAYSPDPEYVARQKALEALEEARRKAREKEIAEAEKRAAENRKNLPKRVRRLRDRDSFGQ